MEMGLAGIILTQDCNGKRSLSVLSWHMTITEKGLPGIMPAYDRNHKGLCWDYPRLQQERVNILFPI